MPRHKGGLTPTVRIIGGQRFDAYVGCRGAHAPPKRRSARQDSQPGPLRWPP